MGGGPSKRLRVPPWAFGGLRGGSGTHLPPYLCHLQWVPPAPEQLQEIVRGTNQRPLGLDRAQATQQKSADTTSLLDLPEDWLDGFFPFGVHPLARRCLQLGSHSLPS